MTMTRARILAFALIGLPAAAGASDYVGTLKLPKTPMAGEVYSFSTFSAPGSAAAPANDNPFQLKLGYQYTRWLAVEGEVSDFARMPADAFSSPATSLAASPFRASGYGVDIYTCYYDAGAASTGKSDCLTYPLSRWVTSAP